MTTPDTTDGTDRARDKAVENTFPASDPPAHSGITGAGSPTKPAQQGGTGDKPTGDKPSGDKPSGDKPTGLPTSDRHEAETAHHDESDPHTSGQNSDKSLGRQRA